MLHLSVFVMLDSDHCCAGHSHHLAHRRHRDRLGWTENVRTQSPQQVEVDGVLKESPESLVKRESRYIESTV